MILNTFLEELKSYIFFYLSLLSSLFVIYNLTTKYFEEFHLILKKIFFVWVNKPDAMEIGEISKVKVWIQEKLWMSSCIMGNQEKVPAYATRTLSLGFLGFKVITQFFFQHSKIFFKELSSVK